MKKILSLIVVIFSLFSQNVFAQPMSDVKVSMDGEFIEFTDAFPFIDENDRTQIPLRAVSEKLGYEVEWDEVKQHAVVRNGKWRCTFNIGELTGAKIETYENGTEAYYIFDIDSPPVIVNDRTYIPLRAMCNGLDLSIDWDGTTSTVIIDSTKPYQK